MDEARNSRSLSTSHQNPFQMADAINERKDAAAAINVGQSAQSTKQDDEDENGFVLGYN